jgi:hypothetical protein
VNWLDQVLKFLLPYRTHLEREVEYLRAQVAQQRRRLDEVENAMLEVIRELGKKEPRKDVAKPVVTIKARGWEAYRAQVKQQNLEEEDEIQGERRDDAPQSA